jgi:exoribonuclease R
VLKVIRREKEIFVGRIEIKKNEARFIPDNRRFWPEVEIINLNDFGNLKNKKVLIKLER